MTKKWFKPIERDAGAGLRHPLDTCPLEPMQYFLLANRIVLYAAAELRRAERVFADVLDRPSLTSIPADVLEERRTSIRDHSNNLKSALDRFLRAKSAFEADHRKKDFVSLIETPIDIVLQLPIRIAISDTYSVPGIDGQGVVFLTVYPCEPSPVQSRLYDHRVIVSHLKAYATEVRPSVDPIAQLPRDVDAFRGRRKKLIGEFLSRTRNAYFSYDYERNLRGGDRMYIEKLAYKETLELMPSWFKKDLLEMG